MDYSIDWLNSLLSAYKENINKAPYFISDWNSEFRRRTSPLKLVKKATIQSSEYYRYVYSSEQKDLKSKILENFLSNIDIKLPGQGFSEHSIAFTPSPTASLFLGINMLYKDGIRDFLVLTPTYHSIIRTLKDLNVSISYFNLSDSDNFLIDIEKLKSIITERKIKALILCDPIYSCGFEISPKTYADILCLCTAKNIWLIIDYALGGAEWDDVSRTQNTLHKILTLIQYKNILFIESTAKRLQINGLKSSIILTNQEMISKIEDYSVQVYGGISLPQLSLIREFYTSSNQHLITSLLKQNNETIQQNYAILKNILAKTNFELYKSNSGIFTMIVHKQFMIMEVDSKEMVKKYLFDYNLLTFPTFQFFLHKENKFGFRVNLLNDLTKQIKSLKNCLSSDIKLVKDARNFSN